MRGLLLPQIVTSRMTTESDFAWHRKVAESIPGDHWWYMWVQRRHQRDVDADWPNLTLFYEQMDFDQWHQQTAAVSGRLYETFNRLAGLFPIDMVLTSRAGVVGSLMLGLADQPGYPVPVVLTPTHVTAIGQLSHNEQTVEDQVLRAVGYALATVPVYWGDGEREAAITAMRYSLSPAMTQRGWDASMVIHPIIDSPIRVKQQRRKRLLYAGRLNSNKKFDRVLKAYLKVVLARPDVEVWVHGGTGAFSKVEDATWHRTSERIADSAEFLSLFEESSVGAYASDDEGVNITVLEMLARGMVLALPDRPWVRRMLGDYPYLYQREDDLTPLLDWLLDNDQRARDELAPVRRMIRSRHNETQWRDGWAEVAERVEKANSGVPELDRVRARLDDAGMLDGSTWMAIRQFLAKGKPLTMTGRFEAARSWSHYKLYRTLRDLDALDDPAPTFRR